MAGPACSKQQPEIEHRFEVQKAPSRCFRHPCEGDAGEQEDMDCRDLFWVRRC